MVTDLKVKKTFEVRNIGLSVFADILNLFNQRNVQIAYGFNTSTGDPYRYGDYDPQLLSNNNYKYIGWYDMLTRLDPRQFSSGRDIRLGLSIDW